MDRPAVGVYSRFSRLYPMFFYSSVNVMEYDNLQPLILLHFLVQLSRRPFIGLCPAVSRYVKINSKPVKELGIEFNRCHCNVWGRDQEFGIIESD